MTSELSPGGTADRSGTSRRSFLRTGGAIAAGSFAAGPLLSACRGSSGGGNSGGASKGSAKALTFWNFYGPSPQASAQSKWFTTMVSNWNKNNDVQVKLRYIANADYVSGNTLQTAFSSGSGPDIFLLSPGDFLRYYNGKVLTDLTPYLEAGVKDDYVPGVLDTRTVDNKIFGLPMEIEPLAMYYNVKAFEKAGLSQADLPTSWNAYLDVAQKLTSGNQFGALLETGPGYYQNFTWYPFMWMGNGSPVDASSKKSAFDSDAVKNALAFWQQTQTRKVAPKKALGTGTNDAPANLGSGYAAMQLTGIWSVADMLQQKPKVEYGVFKLPVPSGGTYTTDSGGWAFVANAKGGNPDAAGKFIAWALGSKSAECVERCRQWNTVAKSNVPPRKSVQDAAKAKGSFTKGPLKTFVDEIVPGARSEPRYPPEVYKAISDAIQGAQLGGKSPAEAAKSSSDTINTYLQGYTGAPIR